jgi:hypothetical protein
VGSRRTGMQRSLGRRIVAFSRGDRAAGISLSTATVVALIWANVGPGSYEQVWRFVPSTPHLVGLRFRCGTGLTRAS